MMVVSKKTICTFVFILIFPLIAFAGKRDEPRLVTVNGDAEVKVAPDEVIITLGVETWNEDLSIAKNENNQAVAKILETARNKGVEEKHVQTDHISIEPRYRDQWERRTFIGYFVRKTVVVTLRDVSKFEPLVSSFLDAGANYVHGIQFRTTELRKHRDKARSLAIKAASEKAEALAGELGQKVGLPHSIREGFSNWWYWSGWGSRYGGGMMQNVAQQAGGGGASGGEGSIAPGQISVTANVTVSFELE
jgi:uncharacterized protein YggE